MMRHEIEWSMLLSLRVVNVVVFERPDVFAKFGRVPVFSMVE